MFNRQIRNNRVKNVQGKCINGQLVLEYKRDIDKNGKVRGRWLVRCTKCGLEKLSYSGHVLKGKVSCRCRRPKGKLHPGWKGYKGIGKHFFDKIRRQATMRNRNYEFKISIKGAWDLFEKQNRKCALSGLDLKFPSVTSANDGTASLDRIDSSKGYTKDNIQWVHKHVNLMKNILEQKYFINLCGLIYERMKNV